MIRRIYEILRERARARTDVIFDAAWMSTYRDLWVQSEKNLADVIRAHESLKTAIVNGDTSVNVNGGDMTDHGWVRMNGDQDPGNCRRCREQMRTRRERVKQIQQDLKEGRREPSPPPRYDDVYYQGTAWLDSLARAPEEEEPTPSADEEAPPPVSVLEELAPYQCLGCPARVVLSWAYCDSCREEPSEDQQ